MTWVMWCFCLMVLPCSAVATNASCPTWHYYNSASGHCECGFWLYCSSDSNQAKIRNGGCATSAGQDGDYYIGFCPLAHTVNKTSRMYSEMPGNASQLDEVMCGPYNRRGLLCGECKEGYGPAVYSLDQKCAKCSSPLSKYVISLYILLQVVPTTLIFICLVVLRFDITSGPLLAYVLFCQAITASIDYHYIYLYNYFQYHVHHSSLGVLFDLTVTVSQFWNLQFFTGTIPPFCISEKLTGLHVHMFKFLPAIYPFILVVISCVIMELHARNYKIVRILSERLKIILGKANITDVTGDAVFHAFASFILLSNMSVLFAAGDVLNYAHVRNSTGYLQKIVFYIDPSAEVKSLTSITYILLAAIFLTSITLIPSFVLCIYPTRVYRYLSRFLSARKRLAITAFAEALHSCFKDGLNGTRDYRAMAGATPFVVATYTALYTLNKFGHASLIVETVMWMMLVCVVSYVKPLKSAVANVSLIFHGSLFGVLSCIIYLWEYELSLETYLLEVAFITILSTPHVLVALWAGYTLTKHIRTRLRCKFRGRGCKVGLRYMANCVRLCLCCGSHTGYQEMLPQ